MIAPVIAARLLPQLVKLLTALGVENAETEAGALALNFGQIIEAELAAQCAPESGLNRFLRAAINKIKELFSMFVNKFRPVVHDQDTGAGTGPNTPTPVNTAGINAANQELAAANAAMASQQAVFQAEMNAFLHVGAYFAGSETWGAARSQIIAGVFSAAAMYFGNKK